MFGLARGKFLVLCITVFALVVSVVPAFAQTPMTSADYIEDAKTLVEDFNLTPLIVMTAVIAAAAFLIKRMRSAAR